MRTCQVAAFVLLTVATVLAAFEKAWPTALIAAGLAAAVAPAALQLT